MNCGKVAELMSEHIDGRLSGSVSREFEAHVSQCEQCAGELDAMRAVVSSLGSLSGLHSPVDCWAGVRVRIGERPARETGLWQWLARPAVAAPAFAVAMLVLAVSIWPTGMREPTVGGLLPVREYSRYMDVHSRLQQQQVLADPDVTFVAAELDRASLPDDSVRP